MSGGGGGGGGSRGRYNGTSVSLPKAPPSPSAADLVDAEIAATLHEAKRVQEVLEAFRKAQAGDFIITALNAGQGDCCVMRLPDGRVVVVDCNVRSANVNLLGFLEKAGIKAIDLLILTHPDQDHVSGLPELAKAVKIHAVVDGRFRKEDDDGERTPGYEDYRAALDGLKAGGAQFLPRTAIAGDAVELGGVKVRFLAPHAPMQADDANEASLAFRVSYKERSVVFGGDVTAETWEKIHKREGDSLRSDLFWCSHHGAESGCYAPAVAAAQPALTIVSVGENTYGHPHPEAMKVYQTHSGDVRKTEDGTIALVSQQGALWRKIT